MRKSILAIIAVLVFCLLCGCNSDNETSTPTPTESTEVTPTPVNTATAVPGVTTAIATTVVEKTEDITKTPESQTPVITETPAATPSAIISDCGETDRMLIFENYNDVEVFFEKGSLDLSDYSDCVYPYYFDVFKYNKIGTIDKLYYPFKGIFGSNKDVIDKMDQMLFFWDWQVYIDGYMYYTSASDYHSHKLDLIYSPDLIQTENSSSAEEVLRESPLAGTVSNKEIILGDSFKDIEGYESCVFVQNVNGINWAYIISNGQIEYLYAIASGYELEIQLYYTGVNEDSFEYNPHPFDDFFSDDDEIRTAALQKAGSVLRKYGELYSSQAE